MQRPELSARARAALDAWVRPGLTNTPLPPDPAGVWRVVHAEDAEIRVASDDGGSASMRVTFGTVSDVQVGTPTWAGTGTLTSRSGLSSSMPAPPMPAPAPRRTAPIPVHRAPVAPPPSAAPVPVHPAPMGSPPSMSAPVLAPSPAHRASSPPLPSSPPPPTASSQSEFRMPLPGGGEVRVQEYAVEYRVGGPDLAGQPPGDIPVPPPIRPALNQAPDLEDWVEQVANRSRAPQQGAIHPPLAGETSEERDARLALKSVLEAESASVGKTMLRFGGLLVVAWMALPDPWGLLGFVGLMLLVVWGVKKSGRLSQEIRQLSHAPGPAGTMGADAPSREVQLGMDVPSGDR